LRWLLLLLLVAGGDARADDPDVAWARIQQQDLPAWAARLAAADARTLAAQDYFRGTASLGAAFPELAGGRPGSESWLRGRLALLDDAGARRASERVALPPALGRPDRRDAWRQARLAALDAEEAAAVLERRVLLGLLQLLAEHPPVSDEALAPERERLRALVTRAEAAWAQDPSSERARDVAMLQEDEALLDEVLSGIRRSATSPGAAQPDPSRDLLLLQEPGRALAAMARLVLLEPFLDATALAQVQVGELAVLAGPALAAAQAELASAEAAVLRVRANDPVEALDVLQERLDRADGDMTQARSRLAALAEGPPGSVEQARRDLASLQMETARTWRDAAVMAVEVKQAGSRAVLDARYRAERAAAAREKAARAEANAESPEEWAAARLRVTEAEAAEQTARMAQDRERVRGRLTALRDGLSTRLDALAPQDLGPGDYGLARQLVNDLRGHVRAAEHELERLEVQGAQRRALVAEAQEGLGKSRLGVAELQDELMLSLFQLVLADWDEALEGQLALVDAVKKDQVLHRDRLRVLLQAARRAQVAALPVSTAEDRRQDRDTLRPSVRAEWALLGVTLDEVLAERWAAMASIGRALDADDGQRERVLQTTSGMLVLVIAWVWLRRRSGGIVALILRGVRRGRSALFRQDMGGLEELLERAARAAVDLAACYALLAPAWALLPELALGVRILFSLAAWRLVGALFDVLVAEHPDTRPAAFTLMPEGRVLARMLVQGVALWAIVRSLAQALVLAVLGSVPLALATASVVDIALGALLLLVFHRWEPLIRIGLARWEEGGPLARWLATPPRLGWLTGWARGLLGFGLVFAQRLTAMFQGSADRGPLGRLFGMFQARSSMARLTHTPVTAELACQLQAEAAPERVLPRPKLDAALAQSLSAWRDAGQRGALLVHGDRGHGKHTWLSHVAAQPPGEGLVVRRTLLDRRVITADAACGWLAESLGLDPVPGAALCGLPEALAEQPPALIVLEEVQRAFLRTVHGFDGLRALLQVVARTGDRHFWILSMHGPAWRYLSGLGSLLNLQMFRTVLQVPPWSPAELRLLVDGRARSCGAPCSYDDLVRAQPLGGDPEIARERSITAWYRMLAEAAHGGPGVALRIWSGALTGGEGGVAVHPGVRLETRLPDDLRDSELFVLAALRVHDELTEDELQRVNNLDPMVVRATIKQLQARGLAWHKGDRVGVEARVQPAVTQVLRRRQFLPGRS